MTYSCISVETDYSLEGRFNLTGVAAVANMNENAVSRHPFRGAEQQTQGTGHLGAAFR
jgi:hypothetical protein